MLSCPVAVFDWRLSETSQRKQKECTNKSVMKYMKAAREDKNTWLEEQCNDINLYHEQRKTREAYKMIRNVNRSGSQDKLQSETKNGKTISDKIEVMQRWTSTAANCTEHRWTKTLSQKLWGNCSYIRSPKQELENDILEEEVRKARWQSYETQKPRNDGITQSW